MAGFVLGFFISVAEPGLLVLANQVNLVTSGKVSSLSLILFVSLGLAVMISVGFVRIFYNLPLYIILVVLYGIVFLFSLFTPPSFLAIAFDASGATTGILAVPFILALSVGISAMKKDSKSSEKDSFGLVAIASVGAILAVMMIQILNPVEGFSPIIQATVRQERTVWQAFSRILPTVLRESLVSLLPLVMILLVLQKRWFRLSRRAFSRMLKGFAYALLGLFLFLLGVNAGFMEVGMHLGRTLTLLPNKVPLVVIGFILGVVTILAEPAVYVLTHQIEDVTSGYVKKRAVLIPLALGVGIAVLLSVIRVLVTPIQLWHYLLPGYLLSLGLMWFSPKLFVGIAFDAGGVATGPMTATFVLAYIQGAADAHAEAHVLIDGFGMIAMVAMMPIITLQILGLLYRVRARKKGVA